MQTVVDKFYFHEFKKKKLRKLKNCLTRDIENIFRGLIFQDAAIGRKKIKIKHYTVTKNVTSNSVRRKEI